MEWYCWIGSAICTQAGIYGVWFREVPEWIICKDGVFRRSDCRTKTVVYFVKQGGCAGEVVAEFMIGRDDVYRCNEVNSLY